jgi:hypothetical protein
MIVILTICFIFTCIPLFLAGVYTGIWIQRHSWHDREVPKIVTTEKVVEVEKPVVVQVPTPVKGGNGGALPIMGTDVRSLIADPNQRAEYEKVTQLLSQQPEV